MESRRGISAAVTCGLCVASALAGAGAYAIASGKTGSAYKTLWSAEAAGWASALGTLFAAIVALKLGLDAMRQQAASQALKRKAAAAIFMRSLTVAISWIRTVDEMEARWAVRGVTAADVDSAIREFDAMADLIPVELAPLSLELDEIAVKQLALADLAVREARKGMPRSQAAPQARWDEVLDYQREIKTHVYAAGERVHKECYGRNAPVSWMP